VASFTPRPTYPSGKSPWNPLGIILCGSRAGLDAVAKKTNAIIAPAEK